jgi:hypothetical protein
MGMSVGDPCGVRGSRGHSPLWPLALQFARPGQGSEAGPTGPWRATGLVSRPSRRPRLADHVPTLADQPPQAGDGVSGHAGLTTSRHGRLTAAVRPATAGLPLPSKPLAAGLPLPSKPFAAANCLCPPDRFDHPVGVPHEPRRVPRESRSRVRPRFRARRRSQGSPGGP